MLKSRRVSDFFPLIRIRSIDSTGLDPDLPPSIRPDGPTKSIIQKIPTSRQDQLHGRTSRTSIGVGGVSALVRAQLRPRAPASASSCLMQERRGSAWFGVPAMIGVLVVVAVVPHVDGLGGVVLAVVARPRRLPDHRRGDDAREQMSERRRGPGTSLRPSASTRKVPETAACRAYATDPDPPFCPTRDCRSERSLIACGLLWLRLAVRC